MAVRAAGRKSRAVAEGMPAVGFEGVRQNGSRQEESPRRDWPLLLH